MDGSNAGHYSWASSSSEATTLQGPLTASSTTSPNTAADSTGPQRNLYYGETSGVKPSRSQGAADVSESRRSSDYTQTNASLPEPTTATNAPPPHPRSDPNAKPKEYSIKTCECSPKDSAVPPGRNLVICIDGTSNKCGTVNTNVLELYSQILKDEHDDQLTYYDSGIGTYATPTWKSLSHLMRVIHHKIDLVIAWNLEKVIIGAYQWLSNHYRTGDKIFLFGFSRGAFQVRALAGMIKTVGLLLPGNDSQIPFAYEHYVNYDVPGPDQAGKVKPIAPKFKEMLSRKDVRVHFIGVWDTVSSVGLVRPKNMFPHIVDCCDHVCYFRHALALDERRVKFLPEYVHEGSSHKPEEQPFHGQARCTANIKEVWFAGTHSDVGGGERVNKDLQLANIPMLWMRNEAIMAGLHLEATDIKWKLTDLEHHTTPPLSTIWKILEHLPIKRLSYKGNQSTSRRPHRGKSRKIVQGQMIHVSVIFRPGYKPSPAFPNNMGTWPAQLHWDDPDRQERLAELDQIWERDLFNHTAAEDLFERLGRGKQSTARILERIACTTSLKVGRKTISEAVPTALGILEPLLYDKNSTENKPMTATERKLIRISAATAFSYLIPSDSKDPDSKTALDKITDSKCLDLVISLISPGEGNVDPEDGPSSIKLIQGGTSILHTQDINEAIKLEVRAQRVQHRTSLKQRKIIDKQEKKRSKDLQRSHKPLAQFVAPVTPVQHTSPETTHTAALQQPHTDIVDKAVAWKDAEYLQKTADKLRPHAFLAMCTFVDHADLRKTIVGHNVLEVLMNLVKGNSDYTSSVAAQALLHMLVYDDVAVYIIDKGLTDEIITIALKEDTRVPVSAARILEELAKHERIRKIMAKSEVPKMLFGLLTRGDINFIKSSRLNALCKFAAYDDLRLALLEIQLVPFLVKKACQKDKAKRKACLRALIKLAEYDKMHEEILKAGFVKHLIKQLGDEDTDRDAQITLVSLCTHEDFRSHIIQMDFLKILVHRLGKKKHFDDAQYSLNRLIQYKDVRHALLTKLPFISILEKAITKGGVILDDLGDAMFSFCLQHDDILQAIMQSRFVEILLENAREGTVWGLEVASSLLQSEFLKIPEFRTKLMDGGLVRILNDIAHSGFLFALTYLPGILSYTGDYDDMRKAMLASDIIFWLTTRMQYVSMSSVVFRDHHFHSEIYAKFDQYHFDIDKFDHIPLSLPSILRMGHNNIHMMHSFLFMMATQPRGFRRMLNYGALDDW